MTPRDKNALTRGRKRKGDEAAIAGRLDEARRLFESVCKADAADVEAWVKLGMIHKRLGDYAAAEACCRRAVVLQPGLGFAHFGLGNALHCRGRVAEAIAAYRRAVELQPAFADSHYLLGNALHEAGEVVEAIASYRRAIVLRPDFVEAIGDLASALIGLGEVEEAEPLLDRALRLQPGNVVALANRSNLQRLAGRVDEAIETFRHAMRIDPDALAVRAGLAGLLEKTGQIEEAERLTKEGLGLVPNDAAFNLVAAQLDRRAKRFDDAVQRLERLRGESVPVDTAAEARILLGQVYDQMGRTEDAYRMIVEGKRLKASVTLRGAAGRHRYLDRVARIARFATDTLATTKGNEDVQAGVAPVFLIGFPRSGTTLLEQMLDSHPDLQTMEEKGAVAAMVNRFLELAGDRHDALAMLGAEEIGQLRALYFEEVARHVDRRPGATLVDKMPLNTVGVPVIWKVFPDAKFIVAVRHPCDVCLSCLMQDFAVNEGMASFFSIEDTVRTYAAVMGAWRDYAQLLPLHYHRIRYEDLIVDVEGETRRLLAFLDLPWNDSVLDHVAHARRKGTINTPSYHQVTQPIYQDAKYRWRRYEEAFRPVMDELRPFIEYFGYADA